MRRGAGRPLRQWELALETPEDELSAVATHEMWGQVYDRLVAAHVRAPDDAHLHQHPQARGARRARPRRAARARDRVARTTAAWRASCGSRPRSSSSGASCEVMVATASLELGIDIGAVDLVVQLGTPSGNRGLLQRVGRAGHSLHGVSQGHPLRADAGRAGRVHGAAPRGARGPAGRGADARSCRWTCSPSRSSRRARWMTGTRTRSVRAREARLAYRDLSRAELRAGAADARRGRGDRRGRMRVHLHRDRVNRRAPGSQGRAAHRAQNGGAIPDTFTYPVVAEPEGKQVGTLDEDFAVESMAATSSCSAPPPGDSGACVAGWCGSRTRTARRRRVPFWRGEAPVAHRRALREVGRLREEVLDAASRAASGSSTARARGARRRAARRRTCAAGAGRWAHCRRSAPSIAERFFDEAGGMQLILHAPFGGRINRAWGLALRKRFCRTFDFELQAAATDDGILLSLGEQHSFPLEDIFDFLHPDTRRGGAGPGGAPGAAVRHALSVERDPGAGAVALTRAVSACRLSIQRARAEDLLAAVFPGAGRLPGQPRRRATSSRRTTRSVNETIRDCLREALDVDGPQGVLRALRAGEIRTLARDVPEPSPLAHALLNSQPYTFLDDAPLEERRARAVQVRRSLPAEDAAGLGALDASAIEQVVADAPPADSRRGGAARLAAHGGAGPGGGGACRTCLPSWWRPAARRDSPSRRWTGQPVTRCLAPRTRCASSSCARNGSCMQARCFPMGF